MQQRQTKGKVGELPAAVYKRQSWRPPAVCAAESFLSGLVRRTEPFMDTAARLSGWYEQFTRRVQPWPGWSPLSLEFRTENPPLEKGTEKTGQKAVNFYTLGTPVMNFVRNAVNFVRGSPERLSEKVSLPATLQPTASQKPLSQTALSYPAIRLAILRTIQTTSPMLRREIRGGFPTHQPLLAALPEAERSRAESAASPSIQWTTTQERSSPSPHQQFAAGLGLLPSAQEAIEKLVPSPSPHQQAAGMSGFPPETQGVIEKLIERTVMPTALPGLELRLVSPEQQASAIHRPSDTDDRSQPTANGSTPPMPVPAALPTPQLDVNAIADKVYQKLQRRHQLERERRGLY